MIVVVHISQKRLINIESQIIGSGENGLLCISFISIIRSNNIVLTE